MINGTTKIVELDGQNVSVEDIYNIAKNRFCIRLTDDTRNRIQKSKKVLDDVVDIEPIYGVTTGFSDMVRHRINPTDAKKLQLNLIHSLSTALGNSFSIDESRAILAARINSLCRGYSGVREELVERLIFYLHNEIIPVIPEIGSLGSSGDLESLAHMALTIIGEGYVFDENGKEISTEKILEKYNLKPLELQPKEGLALVNGTAAMTGLGSLNLIGAKIQVRQAEIISALALECLHASTGAFQPEGHQLARPHKGQIDCAANLLKLFEGSELVTSHRELIEDINQKTSAVSKTQTYLQSAYTLRCVPQILGAVRDTLDHAEKVLTIEINSANDNPLFIEGKEVFHGGNFHGQPVAFVMDFMSIALTQLGVVSERRINRLLNRHLNNELPENLTLCPGLNLGFTGVQHIGTALVAENRTICTPASIQSIPTNSDNLDVVSLGLVAARKCKRILKNNNYILAIELLCATQAVDVGEQYEKLSAAGKSVHKLVRSVVPTLKEDRPMADDINKISEMLINGDILNEVLKLGIKIK